MWSIVVFGDMVGDLISKKKRNPIVTGISIRGGKLNISLVFITPFSFKVPKMLE